MNTGFHNINAVVQSGREGEHERKNYDYANKYQHEKVEKSDEPPKRGAPLCI
jgi:hypothetical protein